MEYARAITQDEIASGVSILVFLSLSVLAKSSSLKKKMRTKFGDNFH